MRARRILIVEDNETTARTLRVFLEAQGYEIACAVNGRLGEELFWKSDFDLVILDIMLPDVDGVSICKSIRRESVVPVVMLTAKTAEDHIVEGLEAGADDYVCKPFGSKELLARIRRCLQRKSDRNDESSVLVLGNIRLDSKSRVVAVDSNQVRLTKSEFNILHLLIKNPGRVFTRAQLIERALGADFDGFDRTIDTHIWSLRKKLGEPRGRPRYIRSELGVGYRMSDDDAP